MRMGLKSAASGHDVVQLLISEKRVPFQCEATSWRRAPRECMPPHAPNVRLADIRIVTELEKMTIAADRHLDPTTQVITQGRRLGQAWLDAISGLAALATVGQLGLE